MANNDASPPGGAGSDPSAKDDPLDSPFNVPLTPIRGIDVDIEAETTARILGSRPVKIDPAANRFETAFEYSNWREDAAKEGRYSIGDARNTYRTSDRLDGFLGFPALAIFISLLDRSVEGVVIGLIAWILALLIWTPWILWRVWSRSPQGDTQHAGTFLAAAWGLLIFLLPAALNPIALTIVFTLVYLAGLFMLYVALTGPPAERPQGPASD
jgi:hypothetical protein